MTTAELLRSHLSPEDDARVDEATCAAALERAVAGRRPRTRVEVAALMVYRGPASSGLPSPAELPLELPRLRRLLARPVAVPAVVRPVTVLPVRRVLSRAHAA